jgi:hypothetical protein
MFALHQKLSTPYTSTRCTSKRFYYPVTASAVKTTFDFGDDDDLIRRKKDEQKRAQKHQVDNLNRLFYSKCMKCCGNDVIRWMEQKWGRRYVASLEKEGEELVLKIAPVQGHGEEYCNKMEQIAILLNDLMMMDYVQDAILNYPMTDAHGKEWGFFGKNTLKKDIYIPLNIYYDGTV